MRVLVCGGRDYPDKKRVYETLDAVHAELSITIIIHGGAQGADSFATDWAKDHDIRCLVFFAEWQRYGRSAGPRRNQQMIDEAKPDIVVAFPGGTGTADMVMRAIHARIQVIEVDRLYNA